VLNCLRVKVKHNNILIHAVPLAGEDFCPKFLGKTNEEWERGVKVIDGDLGTEVGNQLTWPIEWKQKGQQGLHDNGVHRDIVVD
jgi:hypothetical protein